MAEFINHHSSLVALTGILLIMAYGYLTKKADLSGIIAGGFLAAIIFSFTGWQGLFYFVTFFLIGSLASKWRYKTKEKVGNAQENKGKRSAVHAFSNAGPAALFSLLTAVNGWGFAANVAVASAFAAALSDTLSSEIGTAAGKKHWNLLTFKPDSRGVDGAISIIGSAAGVAGSLVIAIVFYAFNTDLFGFMVVAIAGIFGNFTDSVLGASLQRKGWLNNHQVNLLTTFLAGALGFLIALC